MDVQTSSHAPQRMGTLKNGRELYFSPTNGVRNTNRTSPTFESASSLIGGDKPAFDFARNAPNDIQGASPKSYVTRQRISPTFNGEIGHFKNHFETFAKNQNDISPKGTPRLSNTFVSNQMGGTLTGKSSVPSLYRRIKKNSVLSNGGNSPVASDTTGRSDASYGADLGKFYGISDSKAEWEQNKNRFYGVGSRTPKYAGVASKRGIGANKTMHHGPGTDVRRSMDDVDGYSLTLAKKKRSYSGRKRSLGSNVGSNGNMSPSYANFASPTKDRQSKVAGVGRQIMRPNHELTGIVDSKSQITREVTNDGTKSLVRDDGLSNINLTTKQSNGFSATDDATGAYARRRGDYHVQRKYVENMKGTEFETPTSLQASNSVQLKNLERKLESLQTENLPTGSQPDLLGNSKE